MSEKLKAALKAVAAEGIKIVGLPTIKAKLPKTKLGALVDEYHDVREARLALGKVVDAVAEYEKALTEHIIENVSADAGGVVGKRFKAIVKRESIPQVEDWDTLYEHIRKTKSFDLLNRALNRAAFKERAEAGKAVPGVGSFQAKKLSVTKV